MEEAAANRERVLSALGGELLTEQAALARRQKGAAGASAARRQAAVEKAAEAAAATELALGRRLHSLEESALRDAPHAAPQLAALEGRLASLMRRAPHRAAAVEPAARLREHLRLRACPGGRGDARRGRALRAARPPRGDPRRGALGAALRCLARRAGAAVQRGASGRVPPPRPAEWRLCLGAGVLEAGVQLQLRTAAG